MDSEEVQSTSSTLKGEANDNDEESKCSIATAESYSSSSANETEEDDVDSDFNDSLYELIQRMQLVGKDSGVEQSVVLEIPGKINPKYYSKRCIKNIEIGRAMPVSPSFQKVVVTTDGCMSDGYVILTENRASKIFYAISSAIFHSSESLMASQAKLMYLKQIEKDYAAAKKSNNNKEIRRCIRLVNKTVLEYDEAWFEEEWLIASKAFYAPVHVLYNCNRVPSNPHIVRYQFSHVVSDEPPIRIVVDNGE